MKIKVLHLLVEPMYLSCFLTKVWYDENRIK